jgi:hypothetical protein
LSASPDSCRGVTSAHTLRRSRNFRAPWSILLDTRRQLTGLGWEPRCHGRVGHSEGVASAEAVGAERPDNAHAPRGDERRDARALPSRFPSSSFEHNGNLRQKVRDAGPIAILFAGMRRTLMLLATSLCAFACGGNDDSDGADTDTTCSLQTELAGGLQASRDDFDGVACGTQHSFDSGIDNVFISVDPTYTFDLGIEDVREAELGSYAAHVAVGFEGRRWSTLPRACSVTIDRHLLESREASNIGEQRHYRVSGSGTCSVPAKSADTTLADVTIRPFFFHIPVTWRD